MSNEDQSSVSRIIDISIRIAALAILFIWCFRILEPFITLIVWASVIAIALNPAHRILKKRLYKGETLAATLLILLLLAILIVPAVWLMTSTGAGLKHIAQEVIDGNIYIPPPAENVKQIPMIGSSLYEVWTEASTNLEQLVKPYSEEIRAAAIKVIDMIASTGKGLLLFALSIIIAGVLLVHSEGVGNFARGLFVSLAGPRGKEMASIAEVTVRNVARGILGVAFIQSLLAGIGMFIAGVPLAGLWTLLCLVLAIVQIGILPVSLGVIIYIWYSANTLTAILLTIWMVLAGLVDNILKPIFLGKGAPVPMLVVFLGAIGGFILSGFSGLFTGAIVLSLGYKLLLGWMKQQQAALETKQG